MEEKAKHTIVRFLRNVQGKKVAVKSLRDSIDVALEFSQKEFVSGLKLFDIARKLVFVFQASVDEERLNQLFSLLLLSMDRDNIKGSYLAVLLDQRYAVSWISNMKQLLVLCCLQLKAISRSSPQRMDLYLNTLALFTDYTLWKFAQKFDVVIKKNMLLLCQKLIEHLVRSKCYFSAMQSILQTFLLWPHLNGQSLAAMFCFSSQSEYSPDISVLVPSEWSESGCNVLFRQLAMCQLSQGMLFEFSQTILTVSGSVLVLQKKAPETLYKIKKIGFVVHLLKALSANREILSLLNVNSALAVFGNIINLYALNIEVVNSSGESIPLLEVLMKLLQVCESSLMYKGSSTSTWHPFFGWIKAEVGRRNVEGLSLVQKQFQLLCHGPLVQTLVGTPLSQVFTDISSKGKRISIFRRKPTSIKHGSTALMALSAGCELYVSCLEKFPHLSTDLLVGLSCSGDVICKLWHVLSDMSCLKEDEAVKILVQSRNQRSLSAVLTLAIQATQYLIATLDDEELHLKQQYFTIDDLRDISIFLRQLVYKMVQESNLPAMFSHSLALLTLLHSRDCRRAFSPDANFWLEKRVKPGTVVKDIKQGRPYALNLLKHAPYCIPFKTRIDIFMEKIKDDKSCLGLLDTGHRRPATYITIRRGRILEGGFEQLSSLPLIALKGTIRVKFVNEQGLDEAGIDETGVFKEFLEEFISEAFNPSLGLFKVSSNGLLFPSPSSSVQENHLILFELIGRILGKAMYEGIVVDVQFAPFFLSQILEHHLSSLYSSLDELVFLDPDVYKSLSYVKHCDSGIDDLCLTFTWEEDILGKVVTHELIPGGAYVEVTAENRINYVHRMAHFMLYTRMKQQSVAFLSGFHSVIQPSWISIFSPNELQSVIAGEEVDFDVDDLRKHTEYFGGYHSKHQVINWLWEILRNDFNKDEKRAFLKFVTSCSRPPLLGFSQLKPSFGVRCVDISNQEDSHGSLSGVLKGFFSTHHSDKLPTTSTCFNLLKLPNYRKKTILREKLKYAISANAGFELS